METILVGVFTFIILIVFFGFIFKESLKGSYPNKSGIPIVGRIPTAIAGAASSMIREMLPKGIIGLTATLSTIIGKAASIGKTKTMMDMMTAMTDSGTKGSFDTLFSYSDFQLKRI